MPGYGDVVPLCGLAGCREPRVEGAYAEAHVPGLGRVRVALCLPHHDLLSVRPIEGVVIVNPEGDL